MFEFILRKEILLSKCEIVNIWNSKMIVYTNEITDYL